MPDVTLWGCESTCVSIWQSLPRREGSFVRQQMGVHYPQARVNEVSAEDDPLSPNPPKDTDGRREDSGRGWVRELQGRWPGVLG